MQYVSCVYGTSVHIFKIILVHFPIAKWKEKKYNHKKIFTIIKCLWFIYNILTYIYSNQIELSVKQNELIPPNS